MSTAESQPHERALVAEFVRSLAKLGWVAGRNLEMVVRWGAGDRVRLAANAREIVGLAPDAILSMGANVPAVRQLTSRIPIVFVVLTDAAAQTYVANFARPGGNLTGFTSYELDLVGKRLELLREMSPRIARALYIHPRNVAPGNQGLFLRLVKDAAASGFPVVDDAAENAADIERAVAAFAREPDGGLVIAFNAFTTAHRMQIVALAARYRLPAIYPLGIFTQGGGLMSYAFSRDDQFRQAAGYVDRLLRGANPGELPVQAPTKFQLVINLKTARALGLTVPQSILARADEVIE